MSRKRIQGPPFVRRTPPSAGIGAHTTSLLYTRAPPAILYTRAPRPPALCPSSPLTRIPTPWGKTPLANLACHRRDWAFTLGKVLFDAHHQLDVRSEHGACGVVVRALAPRVIFVLSCPRALQRVPLVQHCHRGAHQAPKSAKQRHASSDMRRGVSSICSDTAVCEGARFCLPVCRSGQVFYYHTVFRALKKNTWGRRGKSKRSKMHEMEYQVL